jgi:hypothetical protein
VSLSRRPGRRADASQCMAPPMTDRIPTLLLRALLLNCLTTHYSQLWRECWSEDFRGQRWSKIVRGSTTRASHCSRPNGTWESPLRTDYERRQALVEIDVLVARDLKLTLVTFRRKNWFCAKTGLAIDECLASQKQKKPRADEFRTGLYAFWIMLPSTLPSPFRC